MKHLPLDIQTFKILRERNCLYVDKTEVIYRLTTSASRLHFLSRPRRFGKSLMISTLKSLFEGDKDLFEGLYIYDQWDWSKKRPVIRLDWSSGSHRSFEDIVDSISFQLETNAADYGLTLPPAQPARQFSELIRALHRKTGENVVLLIDEYDSPILDTMGQTTSDLLQQVRILLHDFYKTVKASDDCLHFVFITGISKFSGLSLFSAMNNLRDITFNPDYASICGYTQHELDSNFAEHIEAMLPNVNMTKEKLVSLIKKHYNGYSWDGETSVYNPYSTMYCFADKQFGAYWFSTGTPSLGLELCLKEMIAKVPYQLGL
jgi:hypothetical protein